MKITIEKHPTDPCGRLTVLADSDDELAKLDLLFQAILTNKHKEGKFIGSKAFQVFFQMDPDIGVDPVTQTPEFLDSRSTNTPK